MCIVYLDIITVVIIIISIVTYIVNSVIFAISLSVCLYSCIIRVLIIPGQSISSLIMVLKILEITVFNSLLFLSVSPPPTPT